MKKLIYLSIAVASFFVSCKKKDMVPTETINNAPTNILDTIGQGTFTSYAHGLGGKAILYNETAGGKTLRFEDFNMTSGPDVYVFLSTTSNYSAANVIQVTKLTSGYSNSNINFPVTNTGYTSAHKYVLVYCIQYSTLFGYADLQ